MASNDWFEKDFYAVLGVSKDVSDADLKKTYRKLARQYHPDSNPGDAAAEKRFKEISEAYSVLSDKEHRAEYDQMRAMGAGARFQSGGGGGFEDVFGGMFGQGGRPGRGGQPNFEDVLGGMFGGGGGFGRGGFRAPSKGRDLAASTTLDFVTAVTGDTVKLQASGGVPLSVRIPAGVADGHCVDARAQGLGHIGRGVDAEAAHGQRQEAAARDVDQQRHAEREEEQHQRQRGVADPVDVDGADGTGDRHR